MKELKVKVSFNTPAFLGNSDQVAQWRTPPFKALIRQWWRVVKAAESNFSFNNLLNEENKWFGQANQNDAKKSQLRLKLLREVNENHCSWQEGEMKNWPPDKKVNIPGTRLNVGSQLYLGYGPWTTKHERKAIEPAAEKNNSETPKLWLAFPDEFENELRKTLQLIFWFGTIGSRSRNGWGSLNIAEENLLGINELSIDKIKATVRAVEECLKLEWPHAFGKDERGPLIWKTIGFNNWADVMKKLAEIKIEYRRHLPIKRQTTKQFNERHFLSYPVTGHGINGWDNERIPNQIRFKVCKTDTKFCGLIFHLPCKIPESLTNKLLLSQDKSYVQDNDRVLAVWKKVHQKLDELLPNGRLS